jgi:hypothetical protein
MFARIGRLGLVVCFLALPLAGCNDDSASTGGGTTPVAEATTPVADASGLNGSWYRTTPPVADEPVGVEFSGGKRASFVLSDGGPQVGEITFDYELLDGGRIRLTAAGNPMATMVMVAKQNGSTLTLEPETRNDLLDLAGGTFAKLPAGQSIAARHAERIKEVAAERAALRDKLVQHLGQGGFAIVPADGGGVGSFRAALDLKPASAGQWNGTAYHAAGDLTVAREAAMGVANGPDGNAAVIVQLGAVTGPPGAPPLRPEQFVFVAGGSPDAITLTGEGRTLKVDPQVGQTLTEQYAAAVKKQREAIDAFHQSLGHFVTLEGELAPPNAPPTARKTEAKFALLRVADQDVYQFASYNARTPLVPAAMGRRATVLLAQGKPILRTDANELFVPASDGSADAMDVQASGQVGRLKMTRRMTAEQLAAHQQKLEAFVKQMSTQPLALTGWFNQSVGYDNGYLRPARLTLNCADGKTLAGTYHCDGIAMDLPITGEIAPTMLGLVMKVVVPRAPAGTVPGGAMDESGTFTLECLLDGDRPVVTGRVNPGDGNNRIELSTPSPDSAKALRDQLLAHLSAGGKFAWAKTGSTGGSDEVLGLTLRDAGNGKLEGAAAFRRDRTGPLTGTISEADGMLVIQVAVAATEGDARPVATGPMTLYVIPNGETFHLSGHSTWDKQDRRRYVSYAPAK